MQVTKFNPSELCSRKLWQLVSGEREEGVDQQQLQQAIKLLQLSNLEINQYR